jgi:hypothetical protein
MAITFFMLSIKTETNCLSSVKRLTIARCVGENFRMKAMLIKGRTYYGKQRSGYASDTQSLAE